MNRWLNIGKFTSLAALIATAQVPASCRTQSSAQTEKSRQLRLQHAVDDVFVRPIVAEQELKRLSEPTAKAYLAFLYMSHKVSVPQAGKKIDSLMHAALTSIPEGTPLGDIDRNERVHYKNMETLLRALRFISEADGGTITPSKLFEQFPEACVNAFAAFYFSSMERADTFELSKSDDIFNIPQVMAFSKTLSTIYGDPNPDTQGTMRFGVYRNQRIASIEASLAPQLYFHRLNTKDGKAQNQVVTDFMQMWSHQELYNQQLYAQFLREIDQAVRPLALHYKRKFNLSEETAQNYAKAALKGYSFVFLDNFSHSTAKETQDSPIYTTFSTPNLTLENVKQRLGQRVMIDSELTQALHLAILCGGSVETLEWLLKNGASLKGGIESPLFSAVTRPELVALLIKSGADINETNPLGKTALIQAAQYDALPAIKALLEAGADINHQMLSTKSELPEHIKSEPDYNYTAGSRSALMYAAGFSSAATIEYLLSKGADKSAVDSRGWTAKKFLVWNKRISAAELKLMEERLSP